MNESLIRWGPPPVIRITLEDVHVWTPPPDIVGVVSGYCVALASTVAHTWVLALIAVAPRSMSAVTPARQFAAAKYASGKQLPLMRLASLTTGAALAEFQPRMWMRPMLVLFWS